MIQLQNKELAQNQMRDFKTVKFKTVNNSKQLNKLYKFVKSTKNIEKKELVDTLDKIKKLLQNIKT